MAVRNILKEGDPGLRKACRPVEVIDEKIIELLDDMQQTLKEVRGLGLAAPQVGMLKRVIIAEVGEEMVELINPVILKRSGEQLVEEGCLSVDYRGNLYRPTKVVVEGLNRHGQKIKYHARGYGACVFCHEIDHLDGVLFCDRMISRAEDPKR